MQSRDTHTPSPGDELLAIGEAARLLGVSVETVRRWEREERITALRTLGGQRRFRRGEVEALARSVA